MQDCKHKAHNCSLWPCDFLVIAITMLAGLLMSPYSSLCPRSSQIQIKEGKHNKQSSRFHTAPSGEPPFCLLFSPFCWFHHCRSVVFILRKADLMVDHFVCAFVRRNNKIYLCPVILIFFCSVTVVPVGLLLFLCVRVCLFTFSVDDNLHSVCLCVCNLYWIAVCYSCQREVSSLTVSLLRDCSILAGVWHHLLLSLQQLDRVISPSQCVAGRTAPDRWGWGYEIERQDDIEMCPLVAPVMDDPANGCDCGGVAERGGLPWGCRCQSAPPPASPAVMNVKLIKAH